jgi:hypothetical protein
MKIIPPEDTLADLKKKAAEYEEGARKKTGTVAARLREKAAQCRRWVLELKFGKWTS